MPPSKFIELRIRLDPIARGLGLSSLKGLNKSLQDGRSVSKFCELLAAQYYNIELSSNSNQAGYDGIQRDELLAEQKVEIRILTGNGVKFQQSQYIGKGRICTKKNLLNSLTGKHFVICDVTASAIIKMSQVDAKFLYAMALEGKLTYTGLSKKRFYKDIIKRYYGDVYYVPMIDKKKSNIRKRKGYGGPRDIFSE